MTGPELPPPPATLATANGEPGWAAWLDGLAALGRDVLARDLATDPRTDGTLLHTDLHFENVLAADREPWLAIDPKPLSGDPAYEVAPVLWNRWAEVTASGDVRGAIRRRGWAVVDAADLDPDRARDWAVVRLAVNALWTLERAAPGGLTPADQEWLTTCVTIVKAVTD